MKYSILIYNSAADFAVIHGTQTQQTAEFWASWPLFMKAAAEAGVLLGGNGLQPSGTATTVTFTDGKARVQDGPYADTKEQLGGFVNIDVPDLDTALAWAARIPRLPDQVCEVRPHLRPPGQ
ncbi:MAG: YciI family protein [Pseudomonadota bacterium]|nr:YciI family protein [Pseudomonadota bacterium]